ncbi:MAG: S41 family peptidase [Rudaea sp.]
MPAFDLKQSIVTGVLAGLLVLLACVAPASAAEFRDSDRAHAITMLRDLQREVAEKYFDPAFKGVDLAANAEVAKGRIAKATSIGETFSALAQFLLELDDSHTFFVPPRQTTVVEYGWKMGIVGDDCRVVQVKQGSDAERQGVSRGDLVKSVNGLKPTRETLWRLNYLFAVLRPQPGLHVELVSAKGVARELDLAADVRQVKRVVALTGADAGFDIARIYDEQAKASRRDKPVIAELGKQVLVVRLPTFTLEEDEMRQLTHRALGHESLVLDLRGNHGGLLKSLQALLGGIYASDATIGTLRERAQSTPLVAKGSGKDAFGGRVFVLVDAESASAAELFARVVQLTERGAVIGDRSEGAVMTARYHPLVVSHGENVIAYGVMVAEADTIMADGKRLEKRGVVPDFVVLPTAEDMAAHRDPALAQALKFAGHPLDPVAAGALLPTPAE